MHFYLTKIVNHMQLKRINIKNFRGISQSELLFAGHTVLIGDNNAGKSSVFEALDLVLGPDRLSRSPVIDEHDFYNGEYYLEGGEFPIIEIEVVITGLSPVQLTRFKNNIEFWSDMIQDTLPENSIAAVDDEDTFYALRVKFMGRYNEEEDDFEGETYFCSPPPEDGSLTRFGKMDKRECGFLYLRALRTGNRALSMEKGSLLDIILRLKGIKPKMWEDVLTELRGFSVAEDPELGITGILTDVQKSLREFVPGDWGSEPVLKVSDLTREHLRKTLTIFLTTGTSGYHAPFHHQGTGTINTMVLALLSMIAEEKHNVIFAMEEPEIAIPPYTQKRIVDVLRKKSAQAIFTSHSPFVLEEFSPEQIILLLRNNKGIQKSKKIHFPKAIKPKTYNSEFRLRFSESLLAKRILLTEGDTEATSYAGAGRKLNELNPEKYNSLEGMGIAVFNVGSETAIASYGEYFRSLGKQVFAVFDKQDRDDLVLIEANIDFAYESEYKGFEKLLIDETAIEVVVRFYEALIEDEEWPRHLDKYKVAETDHEGVKKAVMEYLKHSKGSRGAAELLGSCTKSVQIPKSIREVFIDIKEKTDYEFLY